MKPTTIARNYAEALVAVAEAAGKGQIDRYGQLLDAVAGAVQADERIAVTLESPRVPKTKKAELLADALADVAPKEFVRFLQAVVRRGRQGLLREMSEEYQALVDIRQDRVHAGVTLSGEPDTNLRRQVIAKLEAALGKEVRAHFRTDPGILGGVLVRVGDRVFDGTLKRRLTVLRRKMLTGE